MTYLSGGLCVVLLAGSLLWDATAPRVVKEGGFSVVGIEVRTSNAQEMGGHGAIPELWGKFFKQGIPEQIPNKVDSTILAVYTNYAGDRNGDYDFVLGAKVAKVSAVPPGMVAITVPTGKYSVLTSAKGPAAKIVPEAWQRIWNLEDKAQLGGVRAYRSDFEVYDKRGQDPQDSEVDIYISIK
jgi:predicted transcriptional regulator YdeE